MPKGPKQFRVSDNSKKTNHQERSKTLNVRESSQKLKEEQEARSQSFKEKSIDSHPSASGKEAFSSRDQSSGTEHDLRASMKQVGSASTRDLTKRVTDVRKRPKQVENQPRGFTVLRKFKIKRLMDICRLCRSRTSEVQWPSNERRPDRPSLGNPKRDIGSKDQAASSSIDWTKKAEEARSYEDAASAQIEQLKHKRTALFKGLQEQKNESTSKRITRQLSMNERKIQLRNLKSEMQI